VYGTLIAASRALTTLPLVVKVVLTLIVTGPAPSPVLLAAAVNW